MEVVEREREIATELLLLKYDELSPIRKIISFCINQTMIFSSFSVIIHGDHLSGQQLGQHFLYRN